MPEEWDSSPVWTDARERARAEVKAAFAPRPQTCPACGRVEETASRACPHCGASYVVVQPKLSRRAKLIIAGVLVALLVAGGIGWLLASPSINRAKRSEARRAAAEQAAFIRSETRRLKAEQRLHRGRGLATSTPASLKADLERAITADSRARVRAGTFQGPIQGSRCEPVTEGPLTPNSARGGYQCVAINAVIPKEGKGAGAVGGQLGYPFWAVVNYRRRTFVWCKINPRAGELAVQSLEPRINPPAACDLHI
jgi:hypothetical protein